MRDTLLKIYVSNTQFRKINSCSCNVVPFLRLSDDQPIQKYDFIVFVNQKGNERLMHVLELEQTQVHYTCFFDFCTSSHFPLIVVLSHIQESIMHLRLETYVDNSDLAHPFPSEKISYEIRIIRLCIDLLEGRIDVEQFVKQLNILTASNDNYFFESSAAIMESYTWDFQQSESTRILIEKISQTLLHMEQCLQSKEEWHKIWRFAYHIHNIPSSIYEHYSEH